MSVDKAQQTLELEDSMEEELEEVQVQVAAVVVVEGEQISEH